MGVEGEDRVHLSARGSVHQGSGNNSTTTCLKKVSPKGPGSGMRMLTYFVNRAGKGLSATRRKKLERAKELLAKRVKDAKEKDRKRVA